MANETLPRILQGVTKGPYRALGTLVTTKEDEIFVAEIRTGVGCALVADALNNAELLARSWDFAIENEKLRDIIIHAKPLLVQMSKTSSLADNLVATIDDLMKGTNHD